MSFSTGSLLDAAPLTAKLRQGLGLPALPPKPPSAQAIRTQRQIARTSDALFDTADVVEVRLLPAGQSFYCVADELANQAAALLRCNSNQNIHFGPNPRKHPGARSDNGVALARCVWADFDNTGHDQASARIAATELPAPTLLINSGHGVHAYWRLAEPLHDMAAWSAFQRDLAAYLHSDPKVINAERLMRLPGFQNLKPPVVACELIESDNHSRRFGWADLRALVPVVPTLQKPPRNPVSPEAIAHVSPAERLRRCSLYVAKMRAAVSGENGHDDTFAAACECNRFGLSLEDAERVMDEFNDRCKPEWSRSDLLHKLDEAFNKNPHEFGQRLVASDSRAGNAANDRRGLTTEAVLAVIAGDELTRDASGEVYGTYQSSTVGVPTLVRRDTAPLHSSMYKHNVRHQLYQHGEFISDYLLDEVVNCQTARAQFGASERQVFLRHAFHAGNIYIDLCNASGEVVEIYPGGFRVITDSPVLFRRASGMRELPRPATDGSFSELFDLLGGLEPHAQVLLASWLVGTLHPRGPYPLLNLSAVQGAGKSLLAEFAVSLTDPSDAPLIGLLGNERDLCVVLKEQRVVAFDNASGIDPAMSDALCKIVTGAGLKDRKLYTQNETVTFRGCRPIVITSIGEVITRPDLRQRSIILSLKPIPENRRRTETLLRSEFEQIRPRILSAMFRAASVGLKNLASVQLESLPRMADFAAFIVASEAALPWSAGDFLHAYEADQTTASESAVEDSPIGPPILLLMRNRSNWSGTIGDLLAEIDRFAGHTVRTRRDFPQTARGLSNAIERIRPGLSTLGIEVERLSRTKAGKQIMLNRVSVEQGE